MILVTAAFGHQGKLLLPKLAAAGLKIRAARGTPGREDELLKLGASEVFVGDISDPDVYCQALEGCDAVYHISPGAHPNEEQIGFAMVEAAKRVGVRHVVFSSVMHTIIDIIQHRYKRDHEEALIESGVNHTILKPCDYMMWDVHVAPVMQLGALPCFWADLSRKHSYIAMEDLTDVALKVVTEGSAHYFASYELAGPDKLDHPEIARILSRVMDKDIQVLSKTPEDLLEVLWGTKDPSGELKHQADILYSIMRWYTKCDFVGNSNTLEWLLGRKPTTFEQFATKAYADLSAGKAL
ncbi:SDR family oxidoreductase [Mycobacterium sp.]|uniref:SDR family oxidoreductase n=1 Tax=Mycobacterium sp. TaxID=1785 RepID=UPI002DAFCC72|nr:NmrA family NAD(P)-binding protein [Mycobacterium sp.]